MKILYNILVPKFLRDFDDYLLRNYPVIWRTQAAWVLFYGLVATPLLFSAGFFYPVDAQHLTVEPYEEIIMGYDIYHLWSVLLVSIGLAYWAYRQYQLGFPFTKIKDTLLTLVLYAFCFYILFAFTTPAFRLGTIYKTAYHWIDDDDIKQLEASKIYPHGFVLLKGDTIYKGMPADTFFQQREIIFKEICKVEDSLFQHKYTTDSTFWIQWYSKHYFIPLTTRSLDSNDFIRSYISELSNIEFWSFRSNRLSRMGNNLYQDKLSELAYYSYFSYRLEESDIIMFELFQSEFKLRGMYILTHNIYPFFYLIDYYKFLPKQNNQVFKKYNFRDLQDTSNLEIRISGQDTSVILPIIHPTLPYSVANGIQSVKHARLYLQNKVYFRQWSLVCHYIIFLALIFYFIPMLSFKDTSITIIVEGWA